MANTGVSNDYVSDHTTVFAVRKKPREGKVKYVYRILRDLTNFDSDVFKTHLKEAHWNVFDDTDNINEKWEIFYILAIMCPLKSFKQREQITPWIGPEIYRAMRERDLFIKLFRITYIHGLPNVSVYKTRRIVGKSVFRMSTLPKNEAGPKSK